MVNLFVYKVSDTDELQILINHLRTNIDLNITKIFSPYRAVNKIFLRINNRSVNCQ